MAQGPALNQMDLKGYRSIVGAFVVADRLGRASVGAGSASSTSTERSARLSDREIAVMLAVAVSLNIYIPSGFLIENCPKIEEFLAANGPAPFDAATMVAGFVFWLWMNRGRWHNGE